MKTDPRKELAALTVKRAEKGLTFAEATRRLQLERQAFLAAEEAEKHAESRTSRHSARFGAKNIHE